MESELEVKRKYDLTPAEDCKNFYTNYSAPQYSESEFCTNSALDLQGLKMQFATNCVNNTNCFLNFTEFLLP
jgi:hypothetical protein